MNGHDDRPDPPIEQFDALASLLASGAVWAEADTEIEAQIVTAITTEVQAHPRAPMAPGREDRRHLRPIAAVAVLFLIAGVGIGLLATIDDDLDNVTLRGTDLAVGATATATVEEQPSGLRVVLDVEGLAPAAAGTYYQAWVRNDGGSAVTIGTFHNHGDDEIELWAGVDAATYPIITVTLQQEGGGAESSGQVVLQGRSGG